MPGHQVAAGQSPDGGGEMAEGVVAVVPARAVLAGGGDALVGVVVGVSETPENGRRGLAAKHTERGQPVEGVIRTRLGEPVGAAGAVGEAGKSDATHQNREEDGAPELFRNSEHSTRLKQNRGVWQGWKLPGERREKP